MKCQQCSYLGGTRAVARVRTELMNLAVCGQCANEADSLGLACEPLAEPTAANESELIATAA